MQTNLHFITKPEDWHAFHSDLAFFFINDRTMETFNILHMIIACLYISHIHAFFTFPFSFWRFITKL